MNDESPESKRARLDAEFDEWLEKSPLISPAQFVADKVDQTVDDGTDVEAAIKALARALERSQPSLPT